MAYTMQSSEVYVPFLQLILNETLPSSEISPVLTMEQKKTGFFSVFTS